MRRSSQTVSAQASLPPPTSDRTTNRVYHGHVTAATRGRGRARAVPSTAFRDPSRLTLSRTPGPTPALSADRRPARAARPWTTRWRPGWARRVVVRWRTGSVPEFSVWATHGRRAPPRHRLPSPRAGPWLVSCPASRSVSSRPRRGAADLARRPSIEHARVGHAAATWVRAEYRGGASPAWTSGPAA